MKTITDKKVKIIKIAHKTYKCPRCNKIAKRHSLGKRYVRDASKDIPTMLEIRYSKHYCLHCRRFFSVPMNHIAKKGGRFSNKVVHLAIELACRECKTLERTSEIMEEKYHVKVPPQTLHDWIVEELKYGA